MITERHELLEQYLADLERRLAGAEPGERADIVASVREHVEADLAALDRPATPADVAASLQALGSVDAVAAAWSPDASLAARPAGSPPQRLSPLLLAAAVLTGVTVLVLFTLPPLAVAPGIAALVLGILGLRRHEQPRWLPVTAVVAGGVSILVVVGLVIPALFLFALRSEPSSVGDPVEMVEPATSSPPAVAPSDG